MRIIDPNAVLFDGFSAASQPVEVVVRADACDIRLADGTLLASWPSALLIRTDLDAPGDGATFRRRDGVERLVVTDEALLAKMGAAGVNLGGNRKKRLLWLLGGAVVGLAAIALLVDRLPALAAPFMPKSVEHVWSDGIQEAMMGTGRACDAPAGKEALRALMKKISAAAGLQTVPEVTVVNSSMINAFTLPDGRIIVMRGLIDVAADPDELSGVLAHEAGHALHHDPTREMIRRLEVNFVAISLGTGGNVAGAMTELSYGRDAEYAADASALRTLQRAGLRADGLGRFLAKLPDNGFESGLMVALSDHPATADRIARLHAPPTGATAMDPIAWAGVKSICAKPTGT